MKNAIYVLEAHRTPLSLSSAVTKQTSVVGPVVQHSFCNFPDDCAWSCEAQWSEAKRSFAAPRAGHSCGANIAQTMKERTHHECFC